jgi:hypothetical protein
MVDCVSKKGPLGQRSSLVKGPKMMSCSWNGVLEMWNDQKDSHFERHFLTRFVCRGSQICVFSLFSRFTYSKGPGGLLGKKIGMRSHLQAMRTGKAWDVRIVLFPFYGHLHLRRKTC